DDSEFNCQFSSGIKTIAAIPVEPHGVVQFGSTEKITETSEFVNQTKRMFWEIVNVRMLEIASCSSANSQTCPPNGLFPYEDACFRDGSLGPACSSVQSCSFSSNSQAMLLDQNEPVTWLQPNNLVPLQESLASESRNLESWNAFPTQSNTSLPLTNKHQDLLDFGIPDEILQTGDLDISQWIPPSPVQTNDLISQTEKLVHTKTSDFICSTVSGNTGNWGGVLMPVNNGSHLNFHSYKSIKHVVSNDSNALGPRKGLFSELGIEKLLEGLSCTSNGMPPSCTDDRVSSAVKRMKTGNFMSSLQPVVYNSLEGKKEAMPKSQTGLWMANAYSMNSLSRVSQAKKEVEPHKATVKKAKPGTRPRPKDRQQILDRMAELRELIPNGEKMSIDCLLDRTIKHMLFLQSVTKHADRVKQADEPKSCKDKDPSSNGATWACELGNQTMVCPLIVEDLSTPGHMLIEMLCEEQGFFLEMVGVIRGFGLIILNGVMEVRDKIWTRFIVEAEVRRSTSLQKVFINAVESARYTKKFEPDPFKPKPDLKA
ncbi:Myc-type, basic helix-loop-helix (bHLH) domain-containing protein, partial [Cynara cardunculus var. scolymus]